MHLLRRALGLPYKSGYYYDHPRASSERGDGTFTVDNGNVMFTPREPKAQGGQRSPPGNEHVLSSVKVNCDSSRFPEFTGLDERPKFQGGVVHTADRRIFKETFAAEGDEGALSLAEVSVCGCMCRGVGGGGCMSVLIRISPRSIASVYIHIQSDIQVC